VLVPPIGYLEKLREITHRHGIVLIFDEVITAFGRVGGTTASETLGVTPDIITMAKGLTNAAVPMGAVAVSRHIHDGVVEGGPDGIELFHGYTYSGHPLAAAAALATLDLYKSEGIFEHAGSLHGDRTCAKCRRRWQARHAIIPQMLRQWRARARNRRHHCAVAAAHPAKIPYR
jgi:beta-alanine--pyruvate transaminase